MKKRILPAAGMPQNLRVSVPMGWLPPPRAPLVMPTLVTALVAVTHPGTFTHVGSE